MISNKLTPCEKAAVGALIAAIKGLPKNMCISVSKVWGDGDAPNFLVIKRITPGNAESVASLRKKSLHF